MGRADIKNIEAIASFAVNQVITAFGTYDLVVDLGSSQYQIVEIIMRINATAPATLEKRKSIFLIATRDINEAYSQSNEKKTTVVTGHNGIPYYIYSWVYTGYTYAIDMQLSGNDYDQYGIWIRVEHAHIDGSDLRIRFKNMAITNRCLNIEGIVKSGNISIL